MAEQQISLLPFYKGWDTYQELLIKAIEPLSLDQLSLRTAATFDRRSRNPYHRGACWLALLYTGKGR